MRNRIKFASLTVAAASLVMAATASMTVSASAADAQYTAADVAKHATATDCWTIVDGSVYDLTAFVAAHEGGALVITKMCGVDASAAYAKAPASHSASYLAQYGVKKGVLGTSSTGTAAAPTTTSAAAGALSLTEIAKHATATDCWTLIDGTVYDLSAFISAHEGGALVITKLCGIDGSAVFAKAPASHSAAYLTQYTKVLGKLGATTQASAAPTASASASASASATPAPAETKAATPAPAATKAAPKATTITCVKGKVTKKVTAVNPKCPAGYKKK